MQENYLFQPRPPAVAGGFYPGDKVELSRTVEGYLKSAVPAPDGIVALLVPHAGYMYSGATAGAGFAAVRDMSFDTVVILGTGHHASVCGAALYGPGAFKTPLGVMEIDSELNDALLSASSLFEVLPSAHEEEHSIEVQLPFLQSFARKNFKLLPLLLNMASLEDLAVIGKALAKALEGKKALLVISSDMAHYPPADVARLSDLSLLYALGVAVRSGDPRYFAQAEADLAAMNLPGMDTTCCGAAAVMAGAYAALEMGAEDFRLLRYSNSGDAGGEDLERSVGYAAGVFCKGKGEFFPLTAPEKSELLKIARASIENHLTDTQTVPTVIYEYPALNVPAAAFVTLSLDGELRGCIGSLEARKPLAACVAEMAEQSAFDDPRFEPLTEDEFRKIEVEISVLSPLVKATADDIVPGKHGVVVRLGRRSGTYLPQVWEAFKGKEEFLSSLCAEKAGLSVDAWKKPGVELYLYTATVITE